MLPDRKYSFNMVPFDISDPTDKARWEALLVEGADLKGFQEGDIIHDSFTTTALELRQTPSGMNQWCSIGGVVRRYTVIENVIAGRWGKFAGAPVWGTCNTDGEAAFGIFLNNAVIGERVYVMHQGQYINEIGAPAPAPPSVITTDTQGRARTLLALGEFYMGFNTVDVVINGIAYTLVTIGTPILV